MNVRPSYRSVPPSDRLAYVPSSLVPRMCHLKKKSDHNEYGFYFYQENCKHIIGIVDEGSIADKAGLKAGDSIVEVNDVDVTKSSHEQVVAKIKSVPMETKLRVVNQQAETYYDRKSLPSCETTLLNEIN